MVGTYVKLIAYNRHIEHSVILLLHKYYQYDNQLVISFKFN